MAVSESDKRSVAWSFAGTLDMAVFDASQGISCGSSGGIVNSTELFKKTVSRQTRLSTIFAEFC
jgi:hypothetical protein